MLQPNPEPATPLLPVPTAYWVVGVALAWMLPGLIGHDPWKPDEAVAFGVIFSMLHDGNWLIPYLAGEVAPEHAPLLFWVCALFAKVLGGILPLHDAARVGITVFVGATVGSLVLAARRLFGVETGLCAFLLILGSIGFIPEAHQLVPDLATVLGFALGMYGLAMVERSPNAGGAWLGAGLAVVFLGEGPVHTLALAACALLLPVLFSNWRTRQTAGALGMALLVALPPCVVWLWALFQHSPNFFAAWVGSGNHLRTLDGTALLNSIYGLVRVLSWYTWPLWPLALWGVWDGRRTPKSARGIQIPLLMLGVILLVLVFDLQSGEGHKLPLLVPLVILATHGISTLRRGAANALLWFSITFFFLFALTGWIYWIAMDIGFPDRLHRHLVRMQPGYGPAFVSFRALLTLLLWAGWIWILIRMKRRPERPALAWTAGATMLWGLFLILFGNYMDTGRSYRLLSQQIQAAVPTGSECVGSAGLGMSQRAMLHYFAGIVTQRAEYPNARQDCPVILIQTTRNKPRDLGLGWKQIFAGARLGDKNEHYQLFAKIP